MTDNEIIKALECCSINDCRNCLYDKAKVCGQELSKDALDLINRQKAEIERLQEVKEINLNAIKNDLPWYVIHIKAEAIKEFAERFETALDERVSEKIKERNPHWYIVKRILRETKIEMTE